jgi:hypothetical protein
MAYLADGIGIVIFLSTLLEGKRQCKMDYSVFKRTWEIVDLPQT